MRLPPRNLLDTEASPYLRQHAANPVHWRPWGPAALAEAADRRMPILLSVGYAACHWCHVMAHESFEHPDVAAVMNRLFINIKVDREERPDIDQIYMAALSAMGEQGGWPLTMFLTPDARPFWGGTYFPKEPRYGRAGFVQVLEAVAAAWTTDNARIVEGADTLTAHIHARLDKKAAPQDITSGDLENLAASISSMMDVNTGGLRGAPKFPNAPFMHALWLNWLTSGNPQHRDHVIRTLEHMLCGGIYDHVGGGLARYSTDADWVVPHFEKMLYDNAQLVRLCNWAHAETRDELFRIRIEETIAWLQREMWLPGFGFASSLDADSDGEEGLFYTWDQAEISAALAGDADTFSEYFTLEHPSNWEGKPIVLQDLTQARKSTLDTDIVAALKQRLLESRGGRIRPSRDDKVLTDWNGLIIVALVEAGRSSARLDWIDLAKDAYDSILSQRRDDGRLPHSVLGDTKLYPALSSDYAAMINASIALLEATSDQKYLVDAQGLLDLMQKWHRATDGGGHCLTASDADDVLIRIRGDVDDAIPSATSQVIEAIARFGTASGNLQALESAWQTAAQAMGRIRQQPFGQAGIYNSCAILMNARKLIMVEYPSNEKFVPVANRYLDPRRLDLVVKVGSDGSELFPGGLVLDRTISAAYLCEGQTCRPAIHTAEGLEEALAKPQARQV